MTPRLVGALTLFISLGACMRAGPQSATVFRPTAEQVEACASADGGGDEIVVPPYWPIGSFDEHGWNFTTNHDSTQLCAMGESPLEARTRGEIRVRFLWLRTFHPGIAIRIEHSSAATFLEAVQLAGAGGYAPGAVDRTVLNDVSANQWRHVQALLETARFWQLPTYVPGKSFDGSQWIIEVAEVDRYRAIDRQSGGDLEELGRYLIGLSGLRPDRIY